MADANGDVLMFMVLKPGETPMAAESSSSVEGSTEKLMQGFRAGHYFEASNFSFGVDLADDEGAEYEDEAENRPYGRWRSLKSNQFKPDPPFKVEPADVTISRAIDASSPLLLSCCLHTMRFHRAVVVKRARLGSTGRMAAIMRMEFENVWLKDIEWEDGDTVRETLKFKYSAVKVTYVSRKPDGTVGAEFPCEWRALPGG